MDQAKAGFVATVSYRTEHRNSKESNNARQEFWEPIQQAMRAANRESEASIERLESTVLANLPTTLHRLLLQHFQTAPPRFGVVAAAPPPELYAVFFGASIEGYSSALLAIDVGGVKELTELFKGNIDTFTLVMEAFVPAAFASVIPSNHGKAEFVATIAPTAELSRVFTEVRASQADVSVLSGSLVRVPPGESSDGWLAKIPRALLATALSLLTPVVLSLIVLYCAAQLLLQDRLELSKREAVLASQEQDLRKTERAAVVDLEKENAELLRLLRAPQAVPPPKP
jgi:hypothetical protein